MKIAIIGAGAMGSLFGGLLSHDSEVCLYSRNKRFVDAVSQNGLIMTRGEERYIKNVRVTGDPSQIGAMDAVLIYTKGTGTKDAVRDALVSSITPDTLVVTLQNGIGNVEIIRQTVPKEQIAYGFSALTSDVVSPGHIEMTTKKLVGTYVSPLCDAARPRLIELVKLFNKAGISASISDNIDEAIWYKLFVNLSQNTLCAIFRINVSDLMLNSPEALDILRDIISEASLVARAKGLDISTEQAINHVITVSDAVMGHIPSMVRDVLGHKPTEIVSLNEAVVAEGARLGISMPVNEMIVKMIHTLERNYGRCVG